MGLSLSARAYFSVRFVRAFHLVEEDLMNRFCVALVLSALLVPAASAVTVGVDTSAAPWIGFMNVSELPANGGGFVFGQGWGVPDLTATFDDPNNTLTLSPNTIGDPNEFWYQNTSGTAPDPVNPGGPGQLGNKIMEANLFQQVTGDFAGQTVTFEGEILSNTYTSAHTASIFIRDFAPDFSSFNDTTVPAAPGAFSISLATINDPARHVQWGFQSVGENVWVTDVAPFGAVVIGSVNPVPEPGTLAVFGMALAGFAGMRRRS